MSISPVFFFETAVSSFPFIPNHPSTLSITLCGIIFRFETSERPYIHVSTLAGIRMAISGICVSIWIVFISINIYFIARPRTPAKIILPARDPVRVDSINFTDLVTIKSASINIKLRECYKLRKAKEGCPRLLLNSLGECSCLEIGQWKKLCSKMLGWGHHYALKLYIKKIFAYLVWWSWNI